MSIAEDTLAVAVVDRSRKRGRSESYLVSSSGNNWVALTG